MLTCSAKVGKEKRRKTAAGAEKSWKKHWTAKTILNWEFLPVCGWKPWSQAPCGTRVRIRVKVRVGRNSQYKAAVGMGLKSVSERKEQAPKHLFPDNCSYQTLGWPFRKALLFYPLVECFWSLLVLSRLWGKQNSVIIIFNDTITISSVV